MSAKETFSRDNNNTSEIEEVQSPISHVTLRQRLQGNNYGNNLNKFQKMVLSILMDIQSKQD